MKPSALRRFMVLFGCLGNGSGAIAGCGIAVNGVAAMPHRAIIQGRLGAMHHRLATQGTVMAMGAVMIAGDIIITEMIVEMIVEVIAEMIDGTTGSLAERTEIIDCRHRFAAPRHGIF